MDDATGRKNINQYSLDPRCKLANINAGRNSKDRITKLDERK